MDGCGDILVDIFCREKFRFNSMGYMEVDTFQITAIRGEKSCNFNGLRVVAGLNEVDRYRGYFSVWLVRLCGGGMDVGWGGTSVGWRGPLGEGKKKKKKKKSLTNTPLTG